MKIFKLLSRALSFVVMTMLVFLFSTIVVTAATPYKAEIGTCPCGIDDYKCNPAFSGSCNIHIQTICEVDCTS